MSTLLTSHPFAHRGAWDGRCPENTLEAFARAASAGMGIECDVRMSADGVLFVFHDADGMRMTGKGGAVEKCTMAHLAARFVHTSAQCIPTLREVLHVIDGRVPILVEVKTRRTQRALYVQTIARALMHYTGAYAVASFDPFLARALKRAMPQCLVGVHVNDYQHNTPIVAVCKRVAVAALYRASRVAPDFLVVHAALLERTGVPRHVQRRRVPILTWGVRDDVQWRAIAHLVVNRIDDMHCDSRAVS